MFVGVNAWTEKVLKVANLFFQCFIYNIIEGNFRV